MILPVKTNEDQCRPGPLTRRRVRAESGLSLIVTLVIAAGASVLIGGVLYYTSTQTTLTRRINQYDTSVAAAVAATEKIVASITKDFQAGGVTTVGNNLATYTGLVPKAEDLDAAESGGLLDPLTDPLLDPLLGGGGGGSSSGTSSGGSKTHWKRFEFKDARGQVNRTDVEQVSDWTFREVDAKYPGLRGFAATYRIISNSQEKNRSYQIVSAVKQDVQIASIPLSQFQYFYVPDMELHPSTAGMRFNGRIHCNGNIYAQPSVDVAFQNHVTASRRIVHAKHPADPVSRNGVKVSYGADRETGLNTLNIPIGASSGPNDLRKILEPPAGESPSSLLAQERFYNKADLIVVVSNEVVTARSGSYNGGSVSIPWLETRGIVTRNPNGFYDKREVRDMEATDLDMAKLVANYSDLTKLLGRPVKTLWVLDLGDDGKRKKRDKDDDDDRDDDDDWRDEDDDRDDDDDDRGAVGLLGGLVGGTTVPPGVVRIRNGATLPAGGFSIVTPNPIYVQGAYNTAGVPALLAGDAVTILSEAWQDANGSRLLSSRTAANTSINAAVITGIVPTGGGEYSGGVENALRLLENWSGKTLTFNGSVAVLFYSKINDAPWGGPDVYSAPARSWSYDTRLADAAKTPPGMPAARTVFRSDWTWIKPNSKL